MNEIVGRTQLREAVRAFCKALRLRPNWTAALCGLGCVYQIVATISVDKNYDRAIRVLGQAADLAPDSPTVHYNLARALSVASLTDKKHSVDDALEELETAVELGFDKGEQLRNDEDFRALHTDDRYWNCLLYTSPSPRDRQKSRMPSSA